MIKLSAIVKEFAFCLDQEKMRERSAGCERNHGPECVSRLQRNRYSDARRLIPRTLVRGTELHLIACEVYILWKRSKSSDVTTMFLLSDSRTKS